MRFHFPLHVHRAKTCSVGDREPVPIPRQLALVHDEDLVVIRAHDHYAVDDLAGRREARSPERERAFGVVIDLTRW